jgi:hypothetical protein
VSEAGEISCGCGKLSGLPDRKTSMVRDGVEHRYGKLCRPVPERAGREGDQALPVAGAQSVFAEIRRRFDQREATGVKRYGRSLETFNGRDAFLDLEEELLDGIAYATQARLQHRAVIEALIVLGRHLGGEVVDDGLLFQAKALAKRLEVSRV